MICLSKAEEGAFRHLEFNQSPRPLAAESTTRQDLNGISNLREHVAAGQDGDDGCNGGGGTGGSTDMDEKRLHGGQPPGHRSSVVDARPWSQGPSSCLKAVGAVEFSRRLSVIAPPSLPALWGWFTWIASVLAVSFLLNYWTSASSAHVTQDDIVRAVSPAPALPDTRLSSGRLLKRASTCESGGVSADEYDAALHGGAVVVIWFVSTLACGFPLLAKTLRGLRIPQRFFFVVRHFGTGVLIATAFVHLLPTAFISLGDPCLGGFWINDYPAIPGAIALAAIFFVSVIEMVFHPARKCSTPPPGARSKAGASDTKAPAGHAGGVLQVEDDDAEGEKQQDEQGCAKAAMPMRDMQPPRGRSGSVGYSLNRLNTLEASDDEAAATPARDRAGTTKSDDSDDHAIVDEPTIELATTDSTLMTSPEQKLRKERLQCVLLELGILFHSVFIGMALAVSVGSQFVVLLIAIIFHRKFRFPIPLLPYVTVLSNNFLETFEGLALGSRIANIKWPKGNRRQPWLMAAAYGLTTPIGQAIGIATHTLYSPGSEVGLVVVGVMNAISAGLLTFASLVELLSEDFLSDESWEYLRGRKRVVACLLVFLGAFCMALVGAWA